MRIPVCYATLVILSASWVAAEQSPTAADWSAIAPAGLCVQVGGDVRPAAAALGATGRHLVQALLADAAEVARLRNEFQQQGLYGLVTVAELGEGKSLPLAENLVNLLLLDGPAAARLSLAEAARVVVPGGWIAWRGPLPPGSKAGGLDLANLPPAPPGWSLARKPRAKDLDEWTHPQYDAGNNTVSGDRQVGPPRRIRWVTGEENPTPRMVTAAGRNFYAGSLARDSFNGLRLWSENHGAMKGARPLVATSHVLYTLVASKRLAAVDAQTGRTLREYAEAGWPAEVFYLDGLLLAVDKQTIRAVDAATGELRWRYAAYEPRQVAAGDGRVFFLAGNPRTGQQPHAMALALASGDVCWQRADFPWAAAIRRCVYHRGCLAYEVSTLSDAKPGNEIHLVSAANGQPLWQREFVPGMNHMKQARAMFAGNRLWILEHKQCTPLDPHSGQAGESFSAGFCHCFPPVATERFMLAGEMDLTDLATGQLDANRISKGACGRDGGWVPANGLIYVFPKTCVCWPMLRGFAALAPAPADPLQLRSAADEFRLDRGVAAPSPLDEKPEDWPCYRQNPLRSGSTSATIPARPQVQWTVDLGDRPAGPIADDWRNNAFVRGPITAPVIANGMLFCARPDAHEIVALDAATGRLAWRFTATGRIDTPPTLHHGLCLFGTKCGWVYALRADDGRMVWRLQAAPGDQQIVAYGQIESAWPVPGSISVIDNVVYFTAGRQSLADGGIRVFALDPPTGRIHWVQTLDSLPMKNFYASCAMEFECLDLVVPAGDRVTMSRWLFDRQSGAMSENPTEAFALVEDEGGSAVVPRGSWTYAPRQNRRHGKDYPFRPLAVHLGSTLYGCGGDFRSLFRRDFTPDEARSLKRTWVSGWTIAENSRKKTGDLWPTERLAKDARWTKPLFGDAAPKQRVAALVLAAGRLAAAGLEGGLTILDAKDGHTVAQVDLPAPVWDGMAAAAGRLYVSTADGRVLCLADSKP